MLKRRKKLIIKALVLAMCTSLVPTTMAFAQEKEINESQTTDVAVVNGENKIAEVFNNELANSSAASESDFEFDASTGTITKYVGKDTKVVIPSKINGVSVTSIGASSFWNRGINFQSITIPNSVTSIEADAFNTCRSLKNIIIPSSVTSIGKDAFGGCSGFTNIVIPNSVQSIGIGAFNNCTNLKSITLPNGITRIERHTFWGCINLTNITIPKSVTSIGNDAFNCCRKLAKITIPNSVAVIENDVFGGCSSLTTVTIPSSVTNIEIGAFNNCTKLKSITIPDSVTSIGNGAFYACDSVVFNVNSEKIKQLLINIGTSESKIRLKGQSSSSIAKVSSISLNKRNLKLAVGKTESLIAKIAPSKVTNKELLWESSNTEVATVDKDGKVAAIASGTATITCTATDGSGKAVNCTVTVNEGEYLKLEYPDTDGFTYMFEGVNINFDSNIKAPSNWAGIKVTNSQGIEVPITKVHTTTSKKELQMNCPSITNGEYTLFIPANTISDASGKKYNKEITFKFNVKL